MAANEASRWAWLLLLALGCNAKLSVEPAGSGGGAGAIQYAGAGGSSGSVLDSPGSSSGSVGSSGSGANAGSCQLCNGGAGGFVYIPQPGDLDQDCIHGNVVDSGNGVAHSKITTLDHCHAGLACSAAGTCQPIPDCPSALDACVVREVTGDGDSGGAANMGGAGGSAGTWGAGGSSQGMITDKAGVTAMAADEENLYWIEYGTRDSLGNYQNDGALQAMKLTNGKVTTLASNLPGPVGLGLTSKHAYVSTNGAGLVGTDVHPQLVRVPLAGGDIEIVQTGSPPLYSGDSLGFASVGDLAFWGGASSIYSLPATGVVAPIEVVAAQAAAPQADDQNLYYVDRSSFTFVRTPLAGGSSQTVALEVRPFVLKDAFLYGLESADEGQLLTRAPKSGGAWKRVKALAEGNPTQLQFVGQSFFYHWWLAPGQFGISWASLDNDKPPVRLVDPSANTPVCWVGTATALYWSDTHRIFSRQLP